MAFVKVRLKVNCELKNKDKKYLCLCVDLFEVCLICLSVVFACQFAKFAKDSVIVSSIVILFSFDVLLCWQTELIESLQSEP